MGKCEKCGTPILTGKYCSRCESQKNKNTGNIVKTVGGIIIIGVSALLGIKKPWKKDK